MPRQVQRFPPEGRPAKFQKILPVWPFHIPSVRHAYVRGSVGDGRAVDGISDVDGLAVIDTGTSDTDAPMIHCNWIDRANVELIKKYPFCVGVESYLLPKQKVLEDRKSGFYLQSQSICIYGDSLIPQIRPFRVGEEATFSHAKNLRYDIDYISMKLSQNDAPDFVKSCCRKIMKRIVRAAMETVMPEQNRYTRDLFLSHKMFAQACPEEAYRMHEAMHYALNPVSDSQTLLEAISRTGGWLVDFIENRLGVFSRETSFIDDFGFGDSLESLPEINNTSNIQKWYPLNRDIDPVEASIEFGATMRQDGKDPVLLSVGAEPQQLVLPHEKGNISSEIVTQPYYNKQGGKNYARAIGAAWVRRFLGIPAYAQNTFLLQQNGRVALLEAFNIVASERHNPSILIPDLRWPMLGQKVRQAHMRAHEYEISRNDIAEAITVKLREVSESDHSLACLYTNYPHNPTGLLASGDDMACVMTKLDSLNSGLTGEQKIGHVIDTPYFAGCPQKEEGAYIVTPYEETLAYEGDTPWMVVLSFSKAFGISSPGFSIIITDKSLQNQTNQQLATGVGISYSPKFFERICGVMKPENDNYILDHFAALHKKYTKNYNAVSALLGDYLVDGEPNLTTVLEFPDSLIGKEAICSDGLKRRIGDMNDLVEIFGNAGAVTVNCSRNNRHLVRLALSEGTERVELGLRTISGIIEQLNCQ